MTEWEERVITPGELVGLRALARQYPNVEVARSEIAACAAMLGLPKPATHVISDIHGDYRKLRHVINNASGRLRPLVEELFGSRLAPNELAAFLALLYYPQEAMQHLRDALQTQEAQGGWAQQTLRMQFDCVRRLAPVYRRGHIYALFPTPYRELFAELLDAPATLRSPDYINAMIKVFVDAGAVFEVVRAASRLVRNLSVGELFVAGDMGDRGLRIDKVIDYLMRQPHVTVTWGNHDTSWMGACLGEPTAIATVLRLSLRYQRLEQLEEGYGIFLDPLEHLARTVYGDDPAERFHAKSSGLRDDLTLARMQKATAILNFKLEGSSSRKHPEWNWEHRNLLHRIHHEAGTVEIDGQTYPLLDTHFPTLDPADPYALSPEEDACMKRLQQSFTASQALWEQMRWMVQHGAMWQRRDDTLIFHACVPCDENGEFLSLSVDGVERKGRDLFDALASLIRRAFRKGAERRDADADWMWYLWAGPLSPLFGKDRMATFETYFVADKATHKETKNAYFQLIHDADFCRKILREFGVSEDGLIVNGHVPVKIDEGEQPVKRGGNAVTIDGAFSEAYGDHGYTLILDAERISLAEHSHFTSVEESITTGADMIPKITTLREYPTVHHIGDTEDGDRLRSAITQLERLIYAYEEGMILE